MENQNNDSDDDAIYFFDATKFTLYDMNDYDMSGEESEGENSKEESENIENERRVAYENARYHMDKVFQLLVEYAEAVKEREEEFYKRHPNPTPLQKSVYGESLNFYWTGLRINVIPNTNIHNCTMLQLMYLFPI